MGGFFLGKSAQKSYVFLGCIGLPRGVKRCKIEGVKDKGTPTLTFYLILAPITEDCQS